MPKLERFAAALAECGVAYERDVPLGNHCSFRVGGPAELFIEPESAVQIAGVVRLARAHGFPLTVLGRGSNVLIADSGIEGAVLHLGDRFSAIHDIDDTTIACESGLPLARLCEHTLARGLAGLEFAYGIPGTVGGGVMMNAGAYGGELADVLLSTAHIEQDGTPGGLRGSEMKLSYRQSAYSEPHGGGRIITGATVRLKKGDPAAIKAAMNDHIKRRAEKQPLNYPSAGSTFKRPAGGYASVLIDQCGLKGYSVGGAMVSEKHAGFVVNTGGATARDILAVIRHVRDEVRRQTGYALECEVRLLGKF